MIETRKVYMEGGKLTVSLTQRWPVVQSPSSGQFLLVSLRDWHWGQYSSMSSWITWTVGHSTPAASQWMVPSWRSVCWRAGLLLRGTSRGWRKGLTGASWSSVMTSVKSCIPYGITLCKYTEWGLTGKEAALLKKTWGFWWTKEGNMSQLYALVAKNNDCTWAVIARIASRLIDIIISLYPAFLTIFLEYCSQSRTRP